MQRSLGLLSPLRIDGKGKGITLMATKVKVDIEQIYTLASKGYSVTMICNAIGISRTKAYNNRDIINTIKKGTSDARQKVINDLFARSEADVSATATIYLSKQLKVFEDYYPTSTPKNIKEALTKIQDIYQSVARNELNSDKADKLIHYLEVFIKSYELSELEQRVAELERTSDVEKQN